MNVQSSGDGPREMSLGEYSDRDRGDSRTFQGPLDEDAIAEEYARQFVASILAASRSDPFYGDGSNRFIASNEGACSCSG